MPHQPFLPCLLAGKDFEAAVLVFATVDPAFETVVLAFETAVLLLEHFSLHMIGYTGEMFFVFAQHFQVVFL